MFLEAIEIIATLPCRADPDKIRFEAELSTNIAEILPYLNAILEGAIYNHRARTLTIRRGEQIITLHPHMVAASKIADEREAREILNWLKDLINGCYERKDTIEPVYERRQRLQALEIYKLLPGTDCQKCGELTCLAFAVKLQNEGKNIMACDELFSGRYNDRRDELLRLLHATGYKIPTSFLIRDEPEKH